MKPEDVIGKIFLRYTVGPNYQPIPIFLQVVEVTSMLVTQRIPWHFEEGRGFMPVPDLFDGDERLLFLYGAKKAIGPDGEIYVLYNPPEDER